MSSLLGLRLEPLKVIKFVEYGSDMMTNDWVPRNVEETLEDVSLENEMDIVQKDWGRDIAWLFGGQADTRYVVFADMLKVLWDYRGG